MEFNEFLFVVFAGKKQQKHVRKMPEIKKFTSKVMTTFKTILAKCSNFEASSLGIFDKVSISKFYPGLGLRGSARDCIAGLLNKQLFQALAPVMHFNLNSSTF